MRTIILYIFIYINILGLSYYFQDKFIFFPQKLAANFNFQLPPYANELTLTTKDGTKINAIFYHHAKNKKIIIYFHGNAGSLADWKNVSEELPQTEYNLLIIDYRGYGKSEGTFSETGLYADGEAAYDYAKKLGYSDQQIIFYGRSLGAGVAVEMALRHPVSGLILETPFTSITALAWKHYWYLLPNLFLRYEFNNLNKVSHLTMPVLLLHGDEDELISLSHSLELNKQIRSEHTLVVIPKGGHNNLSSFSLYQTAVNHFLSPQNSK